MCSLRSLTYAQGVSLIIVTFLLSFFSKCSRGRKSSSMSSPICSLFLSRCCFSLSILIPQFLNHLISSSSSNNNNNDDDNNNNNNNNKKKNQRIAYVIFISRPTENLRTYLLNLFRQYQVIPRSAFIAFA